MQVGSAIAGIFTILYNQINHKNDQLSMLNLMNVIYFFGFKVRICRSY